MALTYAPTTTSSPEETLALLGRLRLKANLLLKNGGMDPARPNQVGLLPTPGWGRRNYRFMRHVLLPELLRRRRGAILEPDLEAPIAPSSVRITWIGHATFLVQIDGKNILIDPNWANWLALVKRVRHPGVALAKLPKIDIVLVTHAHFDHLQLRSLRKIACGQPILVPQGVGKLVKNRGFGQVQEMRPWDEVTVGSLKFTFTPAKHWGARVVHDVDRGFGGFLIRSSHGRNIYHSGDSAYFDGFAEIGSKGKIDVALLPIGAYEAMSGRSVHMSPEEAITAFRDLGATHVVPMHYGTFPLGVEPLDEPLIRFQKELRRCRLAKRARVLTEGCPVVF